MNERRGYKRYLDSGLTESVPSSSWYRRRKKFLEEMNEDNLEEFPDQESDTNDASQSSSDENQMEVELDENIEPLMGNESSNDNLSQVIHDELVNTQLDSLQKEENSIGYIHQIVENLAEDIDDIEDKNDSKFVEDDIEAECFMDILNDADLINEDDDVSTEKPFKSFKDMLNMKDFENPITVPVDKSVGEIIFMIVKYALVHALSLTQITDLFMLINCMFAFHILPNTRYLIDKLFHPKDCMQLHATCTKCGAYVGKFERKDKFIKCGVCKTKIQVGDYKHKDFFVTIDPSAPISKLLESNSTYHNYVMNERPYEKGHIRDIYDGKRYRNFVKKLNECDKHAYASVIFNTDGAPLFTSSSYSIWPIYLMVNELPYNVRTKELIVVGLWFGKDKPNMQVFLDPFVETMNKLSTEGVSCKINGNNRNIKIFPLVCCVDTVARAPMLGFVQFNGKYGCHLCLHPGESVKCNPNNPRSGNMKYPLLKKVPKNRTVKETEKHMKSAVEKKTPIFGVKAYSHLINLLGFNFIYGVVVDSMHCCSGIAKQFATTWFGNAKKSGIFSKSKIEDIDKTLNNFKVPHQIIRLTRPFSEKAFWKSREWENWILFYSPIILKDVLPEELFCHWILFVEALYLLLKEDIRIQDIDFADQLLHEFVAQTEIIYSKVSMTFNIHLLLHLARSVFEWGPLWSHNAYAFESANGQLLKVIHAAKGVHNQVCRRISLRYCMISLRDRIYPHCSYTVKHFYNNIGTTMVQKTMQTSTARYFGSGSSVDQTWKVKLSLSESALSFYKIVKNGCLFMSSKKINKRSDNTFAQLRDFSYVKIHFFVMDSHTKFEFAIVKKIHTVRSFEKCYNTLQTIVNIDTEESAISITELSTICVHMSKDGKEYLCAVPNSYVY
ncbi:uncharacterized protein LOC122505365 [Leptopilina heterotoma]|uniref:uncharacterized protein LOC122505365 n=1 Tax=Leptopilina heterotoma TaxID=63436 RepID=UPI001CA8A154|nr:uncharacterized protein LOC122505365 [Leptopilina heterotoma]